MRASKGGDLLSCNDTDFDFNTPSYIKYIALATAVLFNAGNPSAVSRNVSKRESVFVDFLRCIVFQRRWVCTLAIGMLFS